ncbi:MAG: hypothetical protein GX850_07195, partial [Clostridiaceae bacterium]|nr:hypothetical protein [Clostridiaceae bacterium]
LPERKLLLLGDNWNPQTWLFFPEAPDVRAYAASFQTLMNLPFEMAVAPHSDTPIKKKLLLDFAQGLNERGFSSARPIKIPGHEHLKTLAYEPAPGMLLVFKSDGSNFSDELLP